VASFLLSVLLGVWYCWQKYWIANNLIGVAFALQAISLLSMGSYQIGCILLSGLFIYDIFWVFGTDVMVTVAKSFDAPIKLLFPHNIFAEKVTYTMLGLGDIVLPGFFIALLLRYDYKCAAKKTKNTPSKKNFRKPYFHCTMIAYILGLVTTIVVMHTFEAPQPALLYLVPFCIGMSLLTALVKSDMKSLWSYSEEENTSQASN